MHKFNSKVLTAVTLAAALMAGCGGGSGGGGLSIPPAVGTASADIANSVSDLFAFINALIAGSTTDMSDPIDINPLTLAADNAADPTLLN